MFTEQPVWFSICLGKKHEMMSTMSPPTQTHKGRRREGE